VLGGQAKKRELGYAKTHLASFDIIGLTEEFDAFMAAVITKKSYECGHTDFR
jgi:hypothetical protein